MRGALILTLSLVYLLTWTGEADKQTQIKKVQLRRRARQGLGPNGGLARRMHLGFGSALSVHSPTKEEDVQADEGAPVYTRTVQRRRAGGKNRVLVISAPHESDGYYRMMMSLLKSDVYCELAERHVHQVVIFHQEGEMGGKVRRITKEGKVMEEPLDTALIPRLMSFLKLEKGKFGIVLLKKTLQVEERYPYPVRLEAIYEAIDQAPARKNEKLRQKGFVQKCKAAGVEGQVEEGTLTGSVIFDLNSEDQRDPLLLATCFEESRPDKDRSPTRAQTTSQWLPVPRTTADPSHYSRARERNQVKTTPSGDNRTDKDNRDPNSRKLVPSTQQPSKIKPTKRKNGGGKVMTNEYEDRFEAGKPTVSDPEETFTSISPTKRVKGKHDKLDKRKKKNDKAGKKEDFPKPTKKPTPPPKGSLASFLDYFENRRRLLLITSPGEESNMYIQQRDEYLESVCEMAIRKVSIITIFGSLSNSTMKIDHYQLENDKPMKGLRQEDLVNQDLITELRKEFSMTYDDFYMVLTDGDMRVKQTYEVPIAMKAVFDYIDTFSSRIREMEQQKRDGVECKKEDKPRSLENFLSRFRWRRRLFIISAPNDEDWAYQQQLYALNSQACNLGLRHIAILKLVGTDLADIGGVLELYPINGSATVDREGMSGALVKDMRNYFQVSPEYFSMLLVGKDGNVKSWYPSPMYSMAIIYDLVDSMQLRRQEMAIQQSLGMRCPEDEYGGYGYHQHGYQDGYHQGYGY
ncbi:Coiled-coil domain containing protein 80 [Dissostichus eleginoides]|uniref:Coiled-coil domain-containing protein 80 n=1 Tax=Dissostichus eleginoides TaxID=100907 RepID=A0AAD9FJ27_DISEL|nr:Coiled-coil domain containing protein 80 [Dissostichus eleginoides]